jgi:hypothetical protein
MQGLVGVGAVSPTWLSTGSAEIVAKLIIQIALVYIMNVSNMEDIYYGNNAYLFICTASLDAAGAVVPCCRCWCQLHQAG